MKIIADKPQNIINKLKIRQTILILIFFCSSFELFSQDFEFKLYYKDPCNTQTEFTLNYFLEKDGIIIIDNTLWKGKVFDLNITDDQTNSIREFNSFVRDFKGTDSMILPIADGMTICRKL